MDFDIARQRYDGYCFEKSSHIYSPRSVVRAMLSGRFDGCWNQTETFEALKTYILMNFQGLRDHVTRKVAFSESPL